MHREAKRRRHAWWVNRLKPGFRHVQIWARFTFGPDEADCLWILMDPGLEANRLGIAWSIKAPWLSDPSMTVQEVSSTFPLDVMRQMFFIGPVTCVEHVKAFLGISAWLVRTPWQLYNYIEKRGRTLSR
jgi:hypothetical protein